VAQSGEPSGGGRHDDHVPVVPPRIGAAPERPRPGLLAAFEGVRSTDVSDAVGRLYTMAPRIRALYEPAPQLVGVVLTVKAWPGDNLAVHGALSMVLPGDVLVVDWHGYTEGCGTGAESLRDPLARGLAGVVIDGGWRDLPELAEMGVPVYGVGAAAFSPAKQQPGELNVPVSCGGVVVHPGDLVVADGEGVAVVPREFADLVVAECARAGQSEVDPGSRDSALRRGRHFETVFAGRGGVRL